jgi:hypothetical protein
MTDWNAIKRELEATTISGAEYVRRGRPDTGRWGAAYRLLKDDPAPPPPPPPPPPTSYPAPPVGPFVLKDGGGTQNEGFYVSAFSSPSAEVGREIASLHVQNYKREGIGFLWWQTGSTPPVKNSTSRYNLHDCIAENIVTDSNQNGTTEFCYRIGQSADVARIVAKNPGWCAIWIGGRSVDSVIRDFDVEALGHLGPTGAGHGKVGIYLEHAHSGTKLLYGKVHSTGTCINDEWWYTDSNYASFMTAEAKAALPGRAGGYGGEIAHCTLRSDEEYGINLGPGIYDYYIHDVKFVGCPAGAISHPKRLAVASKPNRIDWASCDFSECTGPHEVYHDLAIG